MQKEQPKNRVWTWLLPVLAAGLFAVVLGKLWTIYYDLNDDALMAQILSGSYTGVPESRNIQSYYPLTLVLSTLYRLAGSVDWYGLFLLICQFGSLALILARIPLLWKKTDAAKEAGAFLLVILAWTGLLLYHLVFLQYSMTVGMIGAAVIVRFLTMPERENLREWFPELLPQILLLVLGYLLRSEMMLFVSPFVALSFLIRLGQIRGKKAGLMLLTLSMVLAGLALGELGNRIGYRDAAWKEFNRFFDARTQLYDFEKIPDYEGNEEFYERIGLGREQAELIRNYNFGLDEHIDADTLEKAAEYAHEKAAAEKSTGERIRGALWDYRALLSGRTDGEAGEPYRTVSLVLYGLAVLLVLAGLRPRKQEAGHPDPDAGRKRVLCQLQKLLAIAALAAFRSVLFLYLYYNQRPVVRLTHSIFLEEAVILLWMIAGELREKRKTGAAVFCLLAALFGFASFCQIRDVRREEAGRTEVNAPWEEFLSYCREHPENVYLTDVYSTVNYSDPVFSPGEPVNYDLMGGWASKSPLERKKLERLGVLTEKKSSSLAGILLNHENVYAAAESEASMEWLAAYYASLGETVRIQEVDRIGENWIVYSVQDSIH